MTPVCTIIIPYAEYHKDIVQRAIDSANNQTLVCQVYATRDGLNNVSQRRNLMADLSDTPFLCFLDADDTLEPTFVEDCLRAYEEGHYVYTAWTEDARIMRPRACAPYLPHDFEDGRGLVGGYHLVTTLFPTAAFRALGGFDETLPGMEDTDFYMRAARLGICGKYLDKPLLNYSGAGQRSKQFKMHPEYQDIVRKVYDRDGGLAAMSGNCCGISGGVPAENLTGAQPDDIKAQTLYTPSTQYGRATGRFYPRPLYQGQVISVSPLDVAKAPELWKEVIDPKTLTPDKKSVMEAAGLV